MNQSIFSLHGRDLVYRFSSVKEGPAGMEAGKVYLLMYPREETETNIIYNPLYCLDNIGKSEMASILNALNKHETYTFTWVKVVSNTGTSATLDVVFNNDPPVTIYFTPPNQQYLH